MHFHLVYAASNDATFTPRFGTIINHCDGLFGSGNPRVAALIPWHNPGRRKVPVYYNDWLARHEGGDDVTAKSELAPLSLARQRETREQI